MVAELRKFDLPDQNVIIEMLMRNAAKHSKDALLESDPQSNLSNVLGFSNISRAVFLGDARLANTMLDVSELAREHL